MYTVTLADQPPDLSLLRRGAGKSWESCNRANQLKSTPTFHTNHRLVYAHFNWNVLWFERRTHMRPAYLGMYRLAKDHLPHATILQMTLLDGSLKKRNLFERLFDPVLDSKRLLSFFAVMLAVCVVGTPFVIYWNFAYFTAKSAPLWLEILDYVWALGIFFSGAALMVLGLATSFGKSED